MKNKIRFTKGGKLSVLSALLIIAVFNILFYDKMPEQVPSHWNFAGEVDGYMTKTKAFVIMPLLLALLTVFVNFMLDNDPKNRTQSNMAITIGRITMPGILVLVFVIQTVYGLGKELNVNLIVYLLFGILFIAIGNYLPKSKRNYVLGIKIPWTLNSDENWNRTHRLGGIIFIVSGLLFILNIFLKSEIIIYVSMLIFIIPVIYSFYLYTKGI